MQKYIPLKGKKINKVSQNILKKEKEKLLNETNIQFQSDPLITFATNLYFLNLIVESKL